MKSRKLKNNCMFCKQERDVESRYVSVFTENFNDLEIKLHMELARVVRELKKV